MIATLLLVAAGAPGAPPAGEPPPRVASADPDPALTAKFRRADGWVGGDGAFSVPLADGRALWLFSDTFVGAVRDGKRRDVALVNNTVGVQTGSGADLALTYAVQKGRDGRPAALFAPPDGKGWFWLFAGHAAGDRLHVFSPRLEKAGDGAFGFKSIDVWLATVDKFGADPLAWKPTYAKLPFASFGNARAVSFGSAVLASGAHVYVYGYEETPGKPFPSRKLLTARVPEGRLAEFARWEFLGAGGKWSADVRDASPQVEALGTEFSVSFVPGLKKYALVTTENGLSDRIVGRFADAPEGPWSAPVLLFTCPEPRADKKVFAYAAKAHPHLAGPNELVISYAVNAFELGHVLNNAALYWPTFVRVKLK